MDYKDRSVLLASKHEKEKAIADIFLKELSCTICVQDFDTDAFGTFTAEVPRIHSPFDTCVLKAKTAAEKFRYDLAIASEGSFGPHPAIPFMASAHEIMVFVDRQQDWIIAEHLFTTQTNYRMITLDKTTKLDEFLNQVGFPHHALTLQTNTKKIVIAKGINHINSLHQALDQGFQQDGTLDLATDMRAMMNPTRMGVIRELGQQLARRIARPCPDCGVPGFGFKKNQGHLPCQCCSTPTELYQEELWGCVQCAYEDHKPRKDGMISADPSHCPYCNP